MNTRSKANPDTPLAAAPSRPLSSRRKSQRLSGGMDQLITEPETSTSPHSSIDDPQRLISPELVQSPQPTDVPVALAKLSRPLQAHEITTLNDLILAKIELSEKEKAFARAARGATRNPPLAPEESSPPPNTSLPAKAGVMATPEPETAVSASGARQSTPYPSTRTAAQLREDNYTTPLSPIAESPQPSDAGGSHKGKERAISPLPATPRALTPTAGLADHLGPPNHPIEDASSPMPPTGTTPGWKIAKHTFRPHAPPAPTTLKRPRSPETPQPSGPDDLIRVNLEPALKRARRDPPEHPPPTHTTAAVTPSSSALRNPQPSFSNTPYGEKAGIDPPRQHSTPSVSLFEDATTHFLDKDWSELLAEANKKPSPSTVAEHPTNTGTPSSQSITTALQSEAYITNMAGDNPDLGMTIRPTIGFPHPQFPIPGWPFKNVDRAWVAEWEKLPGELIMVASYGRGFLDDQVAPGIPAIGTAIEELVAKFLGATNVSLSTPKPEVPPMVRNSAPWCAVLYGLTPEQRDALIHAEYIATDAVTFFMFPFGLFFSTFMCALASIPRRTADEVRDAVVRIVKKENNARILVAIARRANPSDERSDEEIVDSVCRTIRIDVLNAADPGNIPSPLYNIHVEPLARETTTWYRTQRFFSELDYSDPRLGGSAVVKKSPPCTGCHSADHTRGLCPCLLVPGWRGPGRNDPPLHDGRENNYPNRPPPQYQPPYYNPRRGGPAPNARRRSRTPQPYTGGSR